MMGACLWDRGSHRATVAVAAVAHPTAHGGTLQGRAGRRRGTCPLVADGEPEEVE